MDRQAVFEPWMNRTVARFEKRSQKPARIYERAQDYLPGGDTRTVTFFSPYPLFMAKGEGCNIYDADGNRHVDFLNNHTALIHGYGHPTIVKAVTEQVRKGVSLAASTESLYLLAEIICERVKSVDQVRFCNSGTEATMNAIRAARTISGGSMVVKMEGGVPRDPRSGRSEHCAKSGGCRPV